MPSFTLIKTYLLAALFLTSREGFSQTSMTGTRDKDTSFNNAVNLYHRFLSPETGLYNGSEYTYYAYYPIVINEGHPFFQSKEFDTGSVFYNNILYENVRYRSIDICHILYNEYFSQFFFFCFRYSYLMIMIKMKRTYRAKRLYIFMTVHIKIFIIFK